jgi:nicotinate-nucleotide--dimethylbenzimidazole phosphoribosyltransferase
MTGLSPDRVTGRGTGIDDATHAHKVAMVARALSRNTPGASDPIAVLSTVGGFEIGVLVGVIHGRDGRPDPASSWTWFITGAACLACSGSPAARSPSRCIAGHRSVEPGSRRRPGTPRAAAAAGARPAGSAKGPARALAMSLVDAAVAIRDGMATFESAGVAGPADPSTVA